MYMYMYIYMYVYHGLNYMYMYCIYSDCTYMYSTAHAIRLQKLCQVFDIHCTYSVYTCTCMCRQYMYVHVHTCIHVYCCAASQRNGLD